MTDFKLSEMSSEDITDFINNLPKVDFPQQHIYNGFNSDIDFSKLERPQVKELQTLCKIQEDNANELRQLREEISKERNENTLLNKKLAKYDSIKWWLMAGLTLFAGALGWILSQIFG